MVEHERDERLLENRDKRLGQIFRERTQPHPEPGAEDKCLRNHQTDLITAFRGDPPFRNSLLHLSSCLPWQNKTREGGRRETGATLPRPELRTAKWLQKKRPARLCFLATLIELGSWRKKRSGAAQRRN